MLDSCHSFSGYFTTNFIQFKWCYFRSMNPCATKVLTPQTWNPMSLFPGLGVYSEHTQMDIPLPRPLYHLLWAVDTSHSGPFPSRVICLNQWTKRVAVLYVCLLRLCVFCLHTGVGPVWGGRGDNHRLCWACCYSSDPHSQCCHRGLAGEKHFCVCLFSVYTNTHTNVCFQSGLILHLSPSYLFVIYQKVRSYAKFKNVERLPPRPELEAAFTGEELDGQRLCLPFLKIQTKVR